MLTHLHRAYGNTEQGLAENGVLDLVHLGDALVFRVLDQVVLAEGPVDADIDVLVDSGGQHNSSMPRVVGGQVASTASQGYAQRRAG